MIVRFNRIEIDIINVLARYDEPVPILEMFNDLSMFDKAYRLEPVVNAMRSLERRGFINSETRWYIGRGSRLGTDIELPLADQDYIINDRVE